ncbi:MAG TPA: type II secretion system protein GspM [Candidatus Binataceae bacterium]|nr:type II secretion system protein GspM [Candidatus Binataceae bacterium]
MLDSLRDLLARIGNAVAALLTAIISSRLVRLVATALGRLLNPLIQRLTPAYRSGYAWYEKREARERLLIKVAAAIVGVFILYNWIYLPIAGLNNGMQDRIEARQRELIQVRSLMHSYNRVKAELAEAQKGTVADKNFSLFSVIEQTLDRSVGRDKIGSITPSDRPLNGGFQQHIVDLKLVGLNLPQIVDTLYGVQSLPVPVTVSGLHIRQRAQDSYSYDVDMTCMALGRS